MSLPLAMHRCQSDEALRRSLSIAVPITQIGAQSLLSLAVSTSQSVMAVGNLAFRMTNAMSSVALGGMHSAVSGVAFVGGSSVDFVHRNLLSSPPTTSMSRPTGTASMSAASFPAHFSQSHGRAAKVLRRAPSQSQRGCRVSQGSDVLLNDSIRVGLFQCDLPMSMSGDSQSDLSDVQEWSLQMGLQSSML